MKRFSYLFTQYVTTSFLLLSILYLFLKTTKLTVYSQQGYVFGSLFRMFLYHEQHSSQYLFLVSLVYACIAAAWSYRIGTTQKGLTRAVSILCVMLLTLVVSSIPGGMLWVVHDVQAGFFPGVSQFLKALWWGATTGLVLGWMIFLLSIPFNIVCLFAGYWLTNYIEKRTRRL